jgi:hypothetical protein
VPPGTTMADVDEADPQYPSGYTQTEGGDPTTVTAVAGGTTSAGNDGYYLPGMVSGHLYLDTNGNGTQDAGEPNLADVDVIITDGNGVQQVVTTDADGDWAATVPPGTTTADVDESDPEYPFGYLQTEGEDPTTVTALAGQNTSAGNDGYYLPDSFVCTGEAFLIQENPAKLYQVYLPASANQYRRLGDQQHRLRFDTEYPVGLAPLRDRRSEP